MKLNETRALLCARYLDYFLPFDALRSVATVANSRVFCGTLSRYKNYLSIDLHDVCVL